METISLRKLKVGQKARIARVMAEGELGRRIRKAAPRHSQIRWFVVPKFRNYLVFYEPFQNTIMVVRILHAAQEWTRFFPPTEEPPA